MGQYTQVEGGFENCAGHYVIVAARFNAEIVDRLLAGAVGALAEHGISENEITVIRVPGAFEVPLAVQHAILNLAPAAVIALGAVIRGDTPHFDFVAGECAAGLNRVSLDAGVPVAFGVLTTDTMAQAEERAVEGEGNKGAEAAVTVLEMVDLIRGMQERRA